MRKQQRKRKQAKKKESGSKKKELRATRQHCIDAMGAAEDINIDAKKLHVTFSPRLPCISHATTKKLRNLGTRLVYILCVQFKI